jgi:hypothetical protein
MIRKRAMVTVYVLSLVLVGLLLSHGAGSSGAQVATPDLMARPSAGQLAPQANVYYVATTGSDANPGTLTRPWRTIQKATDTLQAGDTVYIRAGTYHERVVLQYSGNPDQTITFVAYPGETVTIDGSGITVPEYGGLFDLGSRSYIVVSGLRVINSNQYGILADGSSGVLIEGNTTYHTGTSGIAAWGSDHVVIDGNKVELAGYNGMQECITVGGTDAFEVRKNEVFDCRKEASVPSRALPTAGSTATRCMTPITWAFTSMPKINTPTTSRFSRTSSTASLTRTGLPSPLSRAACWKT